MSANREVDERWYEPDPGVSVLDALLMVKVIFSLYRGCSFSPPPPPFYSAKFTGNCELGLFEELPITAKSRQIKYGFMNPSVP